jgi:hypothetical protein
MENKTRLRKLGKASTLMAALYLSVSAMAGAVERGSVGEPSTFGPRFLIVMVDVPLVGFASRHLVRMPVVFPVPAI